MAKSSAKKTASKKSTAKKSAAKKPASKKSTKKKVAAKKAASKRPAAAGAAKKKTTKKASKKKATAKKTASKKPAKKVPAKKSPAKTAKKPTAKKAPAKKASTTKKLTAKPTAGLSKKSRSTRKPPLRHAGRAAASVDAPLNGSANAGMSLEELSESQLKRAKSGLKKKDLLFFRDELLERRAEILGDVANLDAARDNFGGEISNMPLHMADVGSENYDREFNLGLLETEKKLLREIDEALVRIPRGTYGVCHVTGQPIERARLEIKPWAKYSIEVVRERERRGLPT